jgi:DNA-directed RNA polymerase specialized sigma subunit
MDGELAVYAEEEKGGELMDLKKMLSEYTTYDNRIEKLNKKINDAMTHKIDCDTLKARQIDGMPHGTQLSNPTLEAVQKIIDKWDSDIRKMAEEVNRLIDCKAAVDKGLNALTWKEYRLIELRYIIGLTWERVAAEANYGVQHCHRLHRQALEKMRKALM